MDDFQKRIDSLLESYLEFLDEYTRLRAQLSKLQTGIYQNIARANFSAERGLRYGQDQYDERMQASRLLRISIGDGDGAPSFHVEKPSSSTAEPTVAEANSESLPTGANRQQDSEEEQQEDTGVAAGEKKENDDAQNTEKEDKEKKSAGEDEAATPTVRKDPLFWFGLLAPMPLRNAQALAIEATEQIIPRLVTVNAEMLRLEIEVGRARKKRAKLQKNKAESVPGEAEARGTATVVEAA